VFVRDRDGFTGAEVTSQVWCCVICLLKMKSFCKRNSLLQTMNGTAHSAILTTFFPLIFSSPIHLNFSSHIPRPEPPNMFSKRSDIGTSPPTNSDFSWHNAHTFWIIITVAFSLLVLHILYKVTKTIRQQRRAQITEVHQLTVQSSHIFDEVVAAETARRVRGLQVPLRAMTRRSSDVSALPRYEKVGEDAKCEEGLEVEKRGRYTYVVQQLPGRIQGGVNQSSHLEGGDDVDAETIAIDDDVLAPVYHIL
jgi:hypothetical protein